MELAIALQWFNPAIWLIGSELRAVHEYEADASVLSGGVDAHHYLNLLMDRANAKLECKLANAISQQTLKNRFQMMARHRSKPSRLLKVLYLLPLRHRRWHQPLWLSLINSKALKRRNLSQKPHC